MAETLKFDHYEVTTREDGSALELGRGAMGVTYKAFDTSLRIPVALKVINAAYLNSELARQRFVREARAAAALRHPNVASVFHLASEGDSYFYAMEFVDGETVEALIRRSGPINPQLALQIIIQVARALAAAAKLGLVHRDIKPANLMVLHQDEELVVKVIDFGLAKTFNSDSEDLATLSMGGFVGTPHFASPEQLEEKDLDIRSDIYSLGITLWYMLAGRTPFGGSLAQVMSQHLSKPPPFEQLQLPVPLTALLERMLAKDPSDRFQTPVDLRKEAEKCAEALKASPESRPLPVVGDDEFPTMAAATVAAPTLAGDLMATQAAPTVPPPAPAASGGMSAAVMPGHSEAAGEKPPAALGGLTEATYSSVPPSAQPAQTGSAPKSKGMLGAVVGAAVVLIGAGGFYLVSRSKPTQDSRPPTQESTPKVAALTPAATPVPEAKAPTPTPAPAATPAPSVAVALSTPPPAPTPIPTPSRQELIKKRLAEVEKFEAAQDLPRALHEYIQVFKDFPEALDTVRVGLELVAKKMTPQMEKDGSEEFDQIREDLTKAANMDVVSAEMLLGKGLSKREPAAAYSWYQTAASKGYAPAMTQAGLMASNGQGVPKDMKMAASYFQQAADKGDTGAKTCLGECLLNGLGLEKDQTKAVAVLREAAEAGEPRGMNLLATCYQHGWGTDPDFSESMRYFKLAAEAGMADAWANQGVLYMNGQGVSKDPRHAFELFHQGAENGSGVSMLFLARCYEGGAGVHPNPEEAKTWYKKAAAAGNPSARQWCQENKVQF